MTPAVDAYIGLGANLGDPRRAVLDAFGALGALPDCDVVARSPLYRTPAWGPVSQPDYVNAVACVRTSLAPLDMLDALLRLERGAGRDRTAGPQWGPRTLDLDLLLYGDRIIDVPGLRVPHPRLHERAFVIVPLHDIAPACRIPGRGDVASLRAAMETTHIEALG